MSERKQAGPVLAWHYTTREKFSLIKMAGVILPANAGIAEGERPVVWFSLDQHFEPTACKAITDGLGTRMLTVEEMHKQCGLVRFGIQPRRLLAGAELKRKARINNQTWRELVTSANEMGADSGLWFGTLEPLPVSWCVVHEMADGQVWRPLLEASAA